MPEADYSLFVPYTMLRRRFSTVSASSWCVLRASTIRMRSLTDSL